jgi:hypothetical protein
LRIVISVKITLAEHCTNNYGSFTLCARDAFRTPQPRENTQK